MARTKQTARIDSNPDGSIMVPIEDLDFDDQSYSELASAAKTSPSDPSDNSSSKGESEKETLNSASSEEAEAEDVDAETESNVVTSEVAEKEAVDEKGGEDPAGEIAGSSRRGEKYYDPVECRIKQTAFNTLTRRWKEFQAKYNFGPDYSIRKPILGSNVVGYSKKYVPVYWPVLEAGLRFPLHPMILEILRGYELALWQITPNSWLNILG